MKPPAAPTPDPFPGPTMCKCGRDFLGRGEREWTEPDGSVHRRDKCAPPTLCGFADEGWEEFPCTKPAGHEGDHETHLVLAAAPRGTEPRPDPEVGRVYLAPSQEAVERAVDAYGTSCYQEGVAEALRGPYSPVARILDARKRSDAARAVLVALLVGSAASKDGSKP